VTSDAFIQWLSLVFSAGFLVVVGGLIAALLGRTRRIGLQHRVNGFPLGASRVSVKFVEYLANISDSHTR